MSFESRSGAHRAEVMEGDNVKLMMADPRAMIIGHEIVLGGKIVEVHRINTGVPHAIHEVQDLENVPVVEMGRAIRLHEDFVPDGTNADFAQLIDGSTIALRTYERGVEDETLACGTGAVAAALTMAALGKVTAPVAVRTRGGWVLTVGFYMSDLGFCDVSLTGDARVVYRGELEQSRD
jgi:diaminopimelate epimerase